MGRGDRDYERILDGIPHMVWVTDAAGSVEYMNVRATEHTGVEREALYGWRWLDLVHPDDTDRTRHLWSDAVATLGHYDIEYRLRHTSGDHRWVAARGLPELDTSGRAARWIGTWTDIHDEKVLADDVRAAERRSAESLTILEALQETAPLALGFADRDLRIVRANERMAELAACSVDELVGRHVEAVTSPELWRRVGPYWRTVLETGGPILNVERATELPGRPGVTRHLLMSYFPVVIDDDIAGVGFIALEVTERRVAEELRGVIMDNMTEGVTAVDGTGALLFMNRAAERMLGWAEVELRGRSMHAAVHALRPDGAPFAEDDCEITKVYREGRTIRMADDAFMAKDGSMLPVSYSAGPIRTGEAVNGGIVVFRDLTDEKTEHARRQREIQALPWVQRIREALDEDRLVLYSQPILPLIPGGEASEELLLRMVTADGEVVRPQSFLPVAEQHGLIGEIDRWVIGQAVALAGRGRPIEANLSAISIATMDLLPLIEHELAARGADPSLLVFEITETALMRDVERGELFARGLADLGCRLALDDFGTGFGTFIYLKRLPISFLKIDVEFVRDLPSNSANLHLVRAIVDLAKGFGQQTVAEGVEDEATLDLLRAEGVDFAQGYFLGEPAPLVPPSP